MEAWRNHLSKYVTYSTILAAKVKMKFLFLLFKYTPSLLQPIPTPHHSYLKQPSHTLHQRAVAATINIPPNYHCRRKGAIFLLFLCSLQQHTVAAATKYSTQHTAHSTQLHNTQHTTQQLLHHSPGAARRLALGGGLRDLPLPPPPSSSLLLPPLLLPLLLLL